MNNSYSFSISLLYLILISACTNHQGCPHIVELEALKSQLSECQSLGFQENPKSFNHLVYFDIRDSLAKDEVLHFEELLASLAELPGVSNLKYGKFKDVGDQRALSTYEYVLSMSFASEDDYKSYQKHPKHLDVQKSASSYLSRPPVSYDYK